MKTSIDQHAENLRRHARIVADCLDDEEREIAERLQGVSRSAQLDARTLRDTDTPRERRARLELYRDGIATRNLVYFERGF